MELAGVFVLVSYFADEEAEVRAAEAFYAERIDIENAAIDRLANYARTDTLYRIPIAEAMMVVAREYDREQAGQEVVELPEYYYMPATNPAAATQAAIRGAGVPRPSGVPDTDLDAGDSRLGAEATDAPSGLADEAAPGAPAEAEADSDGGAVPDDAGGDTR